MSDRNLILGAMQTDSVLPARTYVIDVRTPIQVYGGRLRAEPGTEFKPPAPGFGKGRFFEQGGGAKINVSNVTFRPPDGGLVPGDYLCGWAMHSADHIGVRFDKCTWFGLNVAYIGYKGRNQDTCLADCLIDQNRQRDGFDSFGLLTAQTGLVSAYRTKFRNGGTRSNFEHQIYLSTCTPLLVDHCEFTDHLYGRYVQVYDGAWPAGPIPSGWTIKDSTFGPYRERMGSSPPGYQIAVQTNHLTRSNLLRNKFVEQHYKSVWVQGNVAAEGNSFTGDGSTAYFYAEHPSTVSSKGDSFGPGVKRTENNNLTDKFLTS